MFIHIVRVWALPAEEKQINNAQHKIIYLSWKEALTWLHEKQLDWSIYSKSQHNIGKIRRIRWLNPRTTAALTTCHNGGPVLGNYSINSMCNAFDTMLHCECQQTLPNVCTVYCYLDVGILQFVYHVYCLVLSKTEICSVVKASCVCFLIL